MATRRIVPRGDGEGGLGTALKRWGPIHTTEIHADNISMTIPEASEADLGLVRLASAEEVNTGTDTEKAVVSATLHQRQATIAMRGLVELATNAETIAGTDDERAVTSAGLQAARAFASTVQAEEGTLENVVMSPATTLASITANTPDIDFASEAEVLAGTVEDKAMAPATSLDVIAASLPGTYARDQRWANGGSDTETNRRTLVSPNRVAVYIDGNGYVLPAQVTKDINTAAHWDNSDYATAANRAGKDFYVYACIPTSGRTADILLSANSTYPDGKTAANSRKIGGFHCLGVSVGTISGHTLTGYLQGDILPLSVWDLLHRPSCAPGGMVYNPGIGHWVDIYLAGIASGELVSRYGVAHQTGETTEKFHAYKFSQWFGRIGKRELTQHEFQSCSIGSNQGTNISTSLDPTNTGGYVDTASRRMISNIGCESCCGVLQQWGAGDGGGQSTAEWVDAFDANDTGVAGQHFLAPNRPRFGGHWPAGARCGSRYSSWNAGPLRLDSNIGSRGCAEPWGGGA